MIAMISISPAYSACEPAVDLRRQVVVGLALALALPDGTCIMREATERERVREREHKAISQSIYIYIYTAQTRCGTAGLHLPR